MKLKYRSSVQTVQWFDLGCQRQHFAVICFDALLFSSRVLRPSLVSSSLTSQVDVQLNYTMRLTSVLLLSHGFQCSPTLNRQPYEGRLPLTSW